MGTSAQAVGGSAPSTTAEVNPDLLPAVPELADTVLELEAKYSGKFHRSIKAVSGKKEVTAAMELANGDRIAGRGPSTADAVAVLKSRLEATQDAQ